MNQIHAKGVGFTSLQENIDTMTPGGNLIFQIFGAMAEFERELLRERANAGLKAARARGKTGRQKEKLTRKQVEMARAMVNDPNISISSICVTFKISKATLYPYVPASGKLRKESKTDFLMTILRKKETNLPYF